MWRARYPRRVPTPVPAEPETRAARRALRSDSRAAADPQAPAARPRVVVAAATVVTALLLAAAAATGDRFVEVVAVTVAGLLLAVGWPALVDSRTPLGTTVVLGLTAVSLGGALALQDEEPYLEHVPAALAVGIIAMCLHPLLQAPARVQLARALAGTSLGILLIGGGGLLTSTVYADNHGPVVIVGVSLAVAALTDLVLERPGTSAWMIPAAMLAGGLAGLLAHLLLSGSVSAWSALLGVIAAGSAAALRRALSQQRPIESLPGAIAAGAASVLIAGPLVHLVARLPLA